MLTCFPEGRSAGRRRINSNEGAPLLCFVPLSRSRGPQTFFVHLATSRLIMCDLIISKSSIFSVAAHWEMDVTGGADSYNFFLGMANAPEGFRSKEDCAVFYGWAVFKTS